MVYVCIKCSESIWWDFSDDILSTGASGFIFVCSVVGYCRYNGVTRGRLFG